MIRTEIVERSRVGNIRVRELLISIPVVKIGKGYKTTVSTSGRMRIAATTNGFQPGPDGLKVCVNVGFRNHRRKLDR